MSLFSWLFSPKAPRVAAESSWLSRLEPTRPAGKRADGAKAGGPNAPPASRKSERMAQRELLYSAVRESMVRAGVLSSSYKFKVLSLDSRGRQYMVMVDLAADHSSSTAQLAEIEALIAQSAKSRYQIAVTAVYWRRNEHVAIGSPRRAAARPAASQPAGLPSDPAALDAKAASSPSAGVAPGAAAGAPNAPSYDPILPAEVEAFKRALSASTASAAAAAALSGTTPEPAAVQASGAPGASAKSFDGSAKRGPQSYTLLTGFEDTEEPDARVPALSGSQYGDLN